MEVRNQHPVIIIGGGLAGLTAANYLHECGIPFMVFEAGDKIAGLATTFKDKDGFSFDFGAHFVTNRLADAIGVDCRDVPRYGEAVSIRGKSYSYPFGLILNPAYSTSAIFSKLKGLFDGNAESAADWYRNNYGRKLADEIAIPLTEAWSGAPGNRLSSAVGDSIPGNMFRTMYLKIASRVLKKAVCCGYSRELPESPAVWHVYPNKGVGELCEKLTKGFEDKIVLGTKVEKILVEEEKVVGVIANGENFPASAVVSTAPVHILAKLIQGSETLEYLQDFRYRPMIFVNIKLEGRHLLRDVVVWTPENDKVFFRLTETPMSMPWLAPEGKTIITCDIGCEVGDEVWAMDEEKLKDLCLDRLKTLIPDVENRFLGFKTLKTPLAYPIFLRDYEEDRQRFEKGTEINGLRSIGRNGEFRHVFMEDAYVRSRNQMSDLATELGYEAINPSIPSTNDGELSGRQRIAVLQAFAFLGLILVGFLTLEVVAFLSMELILFPLGWSLLAQFALSLVASVFLVSCLSWLYLRRLFG